MGLGNCCVNNSLVGCPDNIEDYFGNSALDNSYFSLQQFAQRKSSSSTSFSRNTRNTIGDYIYDIDSNNEYLVTAGGTSGAAVFNKGPSGDFEIGRFSQIYFAESGSNPLTQTAFGGSNLGSSPSYGFFHGGDYTGCRYGYEPTQFLGCYGVCLSGRWLIGAMGIGGVMYADLETGDYGLLIGGQPDIIVNQVKVLAGRLYVGTTGWNKPKLQYGSTFLQQKNAPEYNPGDDLWTQNYYSNGVHVYDFDELLYNPNDSFLKSFLGIGNVNAIEGAGGKVYIATGTRDDSNAGLGGGFGQLIEIDESLDDRIRYNGGSITDIANDGKDVYFLDTSYGVIKYDSEFKASIPWIQVMSNNGLTSLIENEVEACRNLPQVCFDFDTFSFYDGSRSINIDSILSPGTRVIRQVCPPKDRFSLTQETIGVFPSSIVVSEDCIFLGMYQGGFGIFDKTGGSLLTYEYGLYDKVNCDYFTSSDVNAEYSLSIGKATASNNKIYAIDSIQYVANGSGPGVYNPVKQSEDILNFVGLIRGFEKFSGILTIG